jgi:two-component system, LytTR family, response regulator
MIKAIIVDDEPYCCEALATLLQRYCPDVRVIDTCYNGETAIRAIEEDKPQLLFLDIEMPQMNGFQMLEKLKEINFELIFTTSYDQYAIKAIRVSALDYLLKPIDREELQKAVRLALDRLQSPLPQQMEILLQKLNHTSIALHRIALPTMEGLQMIPAEMIVRVQSDSNYSILMLKSKQKIIVSRTLKELEEILEDYSFIRVHNSHLVNMNEVDKYVKGEGGYLLMSDGSTVDVSRSRKDTLLTRLQPGRY